MAHALIVPLKRAFDCLVLETSGEVYCECPPVVSILRMHKGHFLEGEQCTDILAGSWFFLEETYAKKNIADNFILRAKELQRGIRKSCRPLGPLVLYYYA